jgi:hypothetical protein
MLSKNVSTGEVPSHMKKDFPTNGLVFVDMVALPLIFCFFALPLFFFVWIGSRVGGHDGVAPFLFSTITRYIVLPLGLAMLLAAPMVFLKGWRGRGVLLSLGPEGLVRVRGGREETYPWALVETVWMNIDAGFPPLLFLFVRGFSPNVVRIRLTDGRQAEFGQYVDAQNELMAAISRETGSRLIPQAIAAYEAGEEVVFGGLRVHRDGLRYEGPQVVPGNILAVYQSALAGLPPGAKSLSWTDLQEVRLENLKTPAFPKENVAEGWLVIRQSGKQSPWLSTYACNVPNLHVFMALEDHVRGSSLQLKSPNGGHNHG